MKLESRGCGCGPLPYLGIVPGFNRLGGFPDQLAVFIFYPVQIVNILRAGTPVRDGSVGQRHFLQGGRLRAHENFGAVNGIYFRAARFPHGLADAEIRQLLLRCKESGKTILLASHYAEDIDLLCDTVHTMEAGVISRVKG